MDVFLYAFSVFLGALYVSLLIARWLAKST
jgi:hypothetical protein